MGRPGPASQWGAHPGKGSPGVPSLGRDGAAALGFQEGVEDHGGARARAALWVWEPAGGGSALPSAPTDFLRKGFGIAQGFLQGSPREGEEIRVLQILLQL